jgi:hypothetical protein
LFISCAKRNCVEATEKDRQGLALHQVRQFGWIQSKVGKSNPLSLLLLPLSAIDGAGHLIPQKRRNNLVT